MSNDQHKTSPLTEGYVRKGGRNSASKIETRPPAPKPLSTKPTSSSGQSRKK